MNKTNIDGLKKLSQLKYGTFFCKFVVSFLQSLNGLWKPFDQEDS